MRVICPDAAVARRAPRQQKPDVPLATRRPARPRRVLRPHHIPPGRGGVTKTPRDRPGVDPRGLLDRLGCADVEGPAAQVELSIGVDPRVLTIEELLHPAPVSGAGLVDRVRRLRRGGAEHPIQVLAGEEGNRILFRRNRDADRHRRDGRDDKNKFPTTHIQEVHLRPSACHRIRLRKTGSRGIPPVQPLWNHPMDAVKPMTSGHLDGNTPVDGVADVFAPSPAPTPGVHTFSTRLAWRCALAAVPHQDAGDQTRLWYHSQP